jgi:pimeloyl-ACP methyl ester carboxylesterase
LNKLLKWLLLAALALNTAGCGTFVARSLVRAPNRYPTWFAPEAPVTLAFNLSLLTNFPTHYAHVGPPAARLCYRIIEPADYRLEITSTNWLENHKKQFEFGFKASVPGKSNVWTSAPRGTVVLLHGYGLAQFSMLPWGLRLAEAGWRCVLIDLRGHGKSTGSQIYFGIRETNDLSQLLNIMTRSNDLTGPVSVMGESYGAALALRWKTVEPRIQSVVAIAPYASLSNAVLNIRREYAGWVPAFIIKSGLKQLPSVLNLPSSELDTTTVLKRKPVTALFVAGTADKITPVRDVEELRALALPARELIVVPDATHEALTYYFAELLPPILTWLEKQE